MDGLMLTKGVPSPGLAVGREVSARHHHASRKVAALAPRAAAAGGGGTVESSSAAAASPRQSHVFPLLLTRLWPGGSRTVAAKRGEGIAAAEEEQAGAAPHAEREGDNWVLKILRVRSMWAESEADRQAAAAAGDGDRCVGCSGVVYDGSEGCVVAEEEDAEEMKIVFDRESFSRLLRRVSMAEAELYSKMAYLGSLAYIVSKIKSKNLLKRYGLRFVTSSLEKKHKSVNSNREKESSHQHQELKQDANRGDEEQNNLGISASAAYQIVASAASYLQSSKQAGETKNGSTVSAEEASFVATTDSVTAVVAGNEEMKQAIAEDLNSAKSLPCEWYICDDDRSATRYFVIQGSETIASWQTNLLFEPVRFEGLDVPVHRGIYEAAKGMHQQMLPAIRAHLKSHGEAATLRFTGHSLGGSLAVLLNLMLLIRGEAPASSLLPVITFGAPSIMCGGDALLRRLGLPKHHVQAIAMHRDIVPRAFSCHYPDHVAKILKALNGNFRDHLCLKNQKLLYSPMGKLLILQPEEEFSPCHHLLPPGSGLYSLGNSSDVSEKTLRAATLAFLNSPHPLEILSDRSAYGAEGTVYRDHDTNSYLRSVRGVLLAKRKHFRRLQRERRRRNWWPTATTADRSSGPSNSARIHQFSFFAGVVRGGTRTVKRFARLVASQHVRMLVVLLFPARSLFLGAFSGVDWI